VAAAIRAANQPKNSETLDSAAAQPLPENPVAQRAETSGDHSADSATSLMKLGDLAVSRHQYGEAGSYYLRAVDLGDTPETAPALVYLAGQALGKQHLEAAAEFVDRALAVAPTGPLAGRALTYKGNIALANQLPGLAESNYVQALTQDPKGSAEAAFTMETYARLLMEQSRTTEAHTMQQDAKAIRAARVAAISPKWTGEPAAPAQPASPTSRATTVETTPTGSGDSTSRADKAVVLAQTPGVEIARAADAALAGNDGTYRIGGGVSAPMETGGVYRVGGGVSAPVLLSKVEPAYSPEALAAQFQGTVVLSVVIRPDGRVYNIQVVRSLGLGLDEQAAEAVTQWKFEPGKRGGAPVAVGATIEVNFRML
jgi:TonB family protein